MYTPIERAPDGAWSATEIEATARDVIDIGIWESAEEEEFALADSPPPSEDAPESEEVRPLS